MINELQFVRGAVAKKDLVPVLTHFHIYDGRIQGTNGRIYIDHPSSIRGDFTVPAERFLKAVDACDGSPVIKVGKKLSISKGKFKALLPLGEHDAYPRSAPSGKKVNINGVPILDILRRLAPFIGEDASRPWACGVLFKDQYAYATNNVIIARTPCALALNGVNLPIFAINELLRIGNEPVSMKRSDNSITFEYHNGAWLKTALLSAEWPDIEKMFTTTAKTKVNKNLLVAVEKVIPFCPGEPTVLLNKDGVSTEDGDMQAAVSGLKLPECRFRAEPLIAVLREAQYIDLDTYPAPSPWLGKDVEGLIVGVR